MMRFHWLLAAGATALPLLMSAPAMAHPHAWIETRSDVVFDDQGRITAINIEWAFDPDYSALAVEGLDTNADGYYSAGELLPLARENIAALKDYDYFVYAKAGSTKVAYAEVTEYGQILSNGTLKMHFTLPLAEPVDPIAAEFVYRIYDPSFYIAIDFAEKEPVAALGKRPDACRVELRPAPTGEEIDSTRNMLSEKDKDWQPEVQEDFGAMFARPVAVMCKPKTAAK